MLKRKVSEREMKEQLKDANTQGDEETLQTSTLTKRKPAEHTLEWIKPYIHSHRDPRKPLPIPVKIKEHVGVKKPSSTKPKRNILESDAESFNKENKPMNSFPF